jgi:hypothetical protein
MGVKFGEIDAAQILDNEYKVKLVARILELLFSKNPQLGLTKEEIEEIKADIEKELQKKYPNSGIKLIK